MKKGSITVFFALILSIIIVLICASIESVKMMCARTQVANGADVGMYSLFAQYDPDLLEQYDLFYLDASYGAGALQMCEAYRTVEEYMEPVLRQNYLDLSIASGGVTGFSLATDCNGQPFRDQVTAYMKDATDSQGAQLLVNTLQENAEGIEKAQAVKRQAQTQQWMAYYEEEMAWAGNESARAKAELQEEEIPEAPAALPTPVENPIDVIREIQKMGILELVITNPADVSDREDNMEELASQRDLEQGMGALYPAPSESSPKERALFQEYVMENCGMYKKPVDGGALQYQAEYILGKSARDRENLENAANRILEIREGTNLAYLYADPDKRAQCAALAAEIANGFLVPPAAGVIEEAMLLCWAFGESALEVKALFDGGRTPLEKTAQNWNLPLENLSGLLGELSMAIPVTDEPGMDYADYLRALLFLEPEDSKAMRSIDMIERNICSQPGKENFRMDCCVESMEVAIDVHVNDRKTYTALHRYGYNL